MNKNLRMIFELCLIILLIFEFDTVVSKYEYGMCDPIRRAEAILLSFRRNNKIEPVLKPLFQRPFTQSQFYENEIYSLDVLKEEEKKDAPTTKDFIQNVFGKKLKKLAEQNSYVIVLMKLILRDLSFVLFPMGNYNFDDILFNLSELKNSNFQDDTDPYQIILRFIDAIWYMITIYEKEIKCKQGENQKKIVREQIRGLIFGNELLWLTIKSNDKIKNILNPYIYPINTENALININVFLSGMLKIMIDHSSHYLKKIQVLQLSKKTFYHYKKIGIQYIAEETPFYNAEEGMKLVEKFLDNPRESYFLIQGEIDKETVWKVSRTKKHKVTGPSSGKKIDKEVISEASILHVIIPAFKSMKKNLTQIKSELVNFLLKLCDYLNYPEGKDVIRNVFESLHTYIKKTKNDVIIAGNCEESDLISLNNDQFNNVIRTTNGETKKTDGEIGENNDDSNKVTENCWNISYRNEEIFIHKIFELRALYTDTFEYILFEVEKRKETIKLHFDAEEDKYGDLVEETGMAIEFLPLYHRITLECYMTPKDCGEYDLIKFIREKLAKERTLINRS